MHWAKTMATATGTTEENDRKRHLPTITNPSSSSLSCLIFIARSHHRHPSVAGAAWPALLFFPFIFFFFFHLSVSFLFRFIRFSVCYLNVTDIVQHEFSHLQPFVEPCCFEQLDDRPSDNLKRNAMK